MLRILGLCVWGVRTVWHTESDGVFFCPDCGGDRSYRRRTGRRLLTVMGLPVAPRGQAGPVVECSACHGRHGTEALEHPTSARLTAMLRDAAHAVALAVLVAGGPDSRRARRAAAEAVREAGFPDCTEEELRALLAVRCPDGTPADDCGNRLAEQLRDALGPLAGHLALQGCEHLLVQGARIALSDGPYLPAEREALAAVGRCLMMSPEHTDSTLEAVARTPS
ncbi:TerB family tellurite resistance protein [Streptomyces sp. NPDC059506]|uniref:TerB family tellurite resistance protein n=1 Tax=Streptomyces TaxID=1883 RepID=UPI0036AC609A